MAHRCLHEMGSSAAMRQFLLSPTTSRVPVWLGSCIAQALQPARFFSSQAQSDGPSASVSSPPAPPRTPGVSPLQNLGQTLSALEDQGQHEKGVEGGVASKGGAVRMWRWYDDEDERDWQRKELQPKYEGLGHAYLKQVPHSMKKLNRVLSLVRDLLYDEAVMQLRVLTHKAARYGEQVLEAALEDAEEKGLRREKLVVDSVMVTKGSYMKEKGYAAKGRALRITHKRSHVQVTLREIPGIYTGFRAKTIPQLVERQRAALQARLNEPTSLPLRPAPALRGRWGGPKALFEQGEADVESAPLRVTQ